MGRLLYLTIFVAFVAFAGYALFGVSFHPDPRDTWKPYQTKVWGKSDSKVTDVKPFSVKVSDDLLKDLKDRLASWRPPVPTMADVDFKYGLPSQKLAEVVTYWRDSYNWRQAETHLNSLPQFQTIISGLNVHFIHAKADASAKTKIPLLLVHGWPGSVYEFYKVIPMLTANKNGVAFDVVAPSIPGYAFSEAPNKAGFSQAEAAEVFEALMTRLGYKKFIYQGGDWGAIVGIVLTHMFPDKVIGFHTNMASHAPRTLAQALHTVATFAVPELFAGKEEAHKMNGQKILYLLEESGYFHEQATKPDTLGVGLSDSPVGLAAWILEKFAAWAQHVEFKSGKGLSNEEMLTNIMLYWITNHVTSSLRFYK